MASASIESKINGDLRNRYFGFPAPYFPDLSFAQAPNMHPSMAGCEHRMAVLDAQLNSNGYPIENGHPSVTVSTTFRVGYRGRSLISVVGDGFYAATPSAHPNDFWWTQNVDVADGRSLTFGDLFFTDAMHTKRLHDLIEQSLRAAPYAKEYGLVESFDAGEFPGDLQPLVCAGRVRFFDIFVVHAVASVTAFVSGKDLIAGGVVRNRAAIAALEQPSRSSDSCGQFY